MKTFLTLLLISLLLFTSCQKESNTDLPGDSVLSGTITDHANRVLKISDFLGKSEWKQDIVVSDSTFELKMELEKPAIKTLQNELVWKDIYLEPNKTLKVYFDANNIEESLQYASDLAEENSILEAVNKVLDGVSFRVVYDLELEEAIPYLDSIKNKSKAVLQQRSTANKISPDFMTYANAHIDYNIASYKIRIGERKETQPENYYAFLDELSYTDPDFLNVPEYRMFLYSYIERESNLRLKALDSLQRNLPDAEFAQNLEVMKELENEEIRDYSLYNAMIMKLRRSTVEDFEKHFDYFKMHGTDPYVKKLETAFNKKKMIIAGKTAPAFTLQDINGKKVSLSDFKGQYVFLDFWNSRCGRCRRELPHFTKLVSDYKNENIAFVTISNDPKESDWKTYVNEKKDVGSSLWADNF